MSSYIVLKIRVSVVRAVVWFSGFYRRYILGKVRDADTALKRRTRELRISSSKYNRQIKVNVWEPKGGFVDVNVPRPVHINFHGQSFIAFAVSPP